ncbi:MAG: hypothetical protein AVDCRST_MAG17-2062 [uncultured Solirubrobacterales bacterium]|uniref:Uncharacterized protein n=1 Tax=uncultured Solirubrobacterales bacterium TaxID=768556 RepID=A0A6J4T2P2_9ACTN|nr:MAG: hypothetical protein AVDCRST_MAG17-2062 [uncultured Solirubrobacterales bacterium]
MADSVVRRAPRVLGALAAAVVLVGAGAAPARAAAPPPPGRAAILVLPWSDAAGGDRVLLERLGERRRGLAVGLTSPTVGGHSPEQFALDLSQGTRVPLGLYGGAPPSLALRARPGGRAAVERWEAVRARARRAPARVEPGLLATVARRAGRDVAYLGPWRAPQAAVAADLGGRVDAHPSVPARAAAGQAGSAWGEADLLVARLPDGNAGLAVVDRLLGLRAPSDLVYVVRVPPPAAPRAPLLATGLAGPGFEAGRGFASATTRRPGLVTATDVAPTVLERLGVPVPSTMAGRRIEARPGSAGAGAAIRQRERLSAILPGRPPALLGLLAAWVAVVAALALARGRAGTRTGLRLGLLAALWFPGLSLATAALSVSIPPSVVLESALLALGSLALAAITDRLLPWPRGPALPAAAVVCAYTIDLALGSPLTAISLVGPNPAGGARFFGIGNELEALLSVSVLIGVGAALSRTLKSPGRVAATFAAAGLVAAAVLGAGRLGADVGAVVTLGAGTAAAAACAPPPGAGRRAVAALVVLAPVLALGALVVLDSSTGGDAHLSRSVLDGGSEGIVAALERRMATQLDLLGSAVGALIAAAGLCVLIAVAVRRRSALAPLREAGARPLTAGLSGAFAAVLICALANDSAPDVLVIGAVLALLAAGYVHSEPSKQERRPTLERDTSRRYDEARSRPTAA